MREEAKSRVLAEIEFEIRNWGQGRHISVRELAERILDEMQQGVARMTWHPISTLPALWDEVPDLEVRSSSGEIRPAAFDNDDGWMDLSDPENPVELGWEPVEWRART